MTMTNLASIADLLQSSDAHFRVFDMGRRVQNLSKQQFQEFENALTPYPYPLQRHAWLAILFWHKDAISKPFLWFVKLPLDEQGKLIQATRNHFVAIVIEALGQQGISGDLSEQQQKRLEQNPYHFTPQQNKLAVLNSQIRFQLHQPASDFYAPVQQYLHSQDLQQGWQELGIQGLSDIAARISEKDNANILASQLPNLPMPVLNGLAASLEHNTPTTAMTESLVMMLQKAVAEENQEKTLACLRALSNSSASGLKKRSIDTILSKKSFNLDIAQLIPARAWETLQEPDSMLKFMEALATLDDDKNFEIFIAIMQDLLFLPATKATALACLRSPERSAQLSIAVGHLFGAARS